MIMRKFELGILTDLNSESVISRKKCVSGILSTVNLITLELGKMTGNCTSPYRFPLFLVYGFDYI